jgi:hypothetical protein
MPHGRVPAAEVEEASVVVVLVADTPEAEARPAQAAQALE